MIRTSPSRLAVFPFILLAGSVAAGACSSSDDAEAPPVSDSGPPPKEAAAPQDSGPAEIVTIDRQAAATKHAEADCAFNARCTPALSASGQTEEGCRAYRLKEILAESGADAKFDSAAVDQAVACMQAASCDAVYGGKIADTCPWPPPVNGAAEGAKCSHDGICASGFCSGATDSACGTCAKATTVAAGQACNDAEGKMCERGAVCLGGGEAGFKCIKNVGVGGDCDSAGAATTGLARCGVGLLCTDGKCVKAGGLGADCENVLDCDIYAGFACATNNTCEQITYDGASSGCNMFGPNLCTIDLYCNAPAAMGTGASTTGNCNARVASGAACTVKAQCPKGDECKGGTCKAVGTSLPACN